LGGKAFGLREFKDLILCVGSNLSWWEN